MTDRELIEAAAKAAGNGAVWYEQFGMAIDAGYSLPTRWNPLTDDGDALRLAVKLGLDVDCEHDPICVGMMDWDRHCGVREPKGHDEYAATRRAIVRAAAELAK